MTAFDSNDHRPLLVYDGECGFCGYWQRYWQRLTDERVIYEAYQTAAARFPDIPVSEFRRAVQYITAQGRASGAEASFLTLDNAPGGCVWLKLYRKFPWFAKLSERVYALIAAHRPLFYGISKLLWGRERYPSSYDLVSWLFLRGLGFIYLFAFTSFAVQAMGLIGSHGIEPLHRLTELIRNNHWVLEENPLRPFMPMVFWLDDSDAAINVVSWAGALLSLLLIFNVLPRACLVLLYIFYLSLYYGGQSFMTYQWDIFLIETGFLGIILTFSTHMGIWLLRWLIFRFMFMSGCVKLLSGDETWANLTALSYHFLTQPLPTPVAWHVAQLSPAALKFGTFMTFVVELGCPWLFFLPRRLRFLGAFGTLLLELCITLTGNYNFFNLQTMLLCLPLFDDEAVKVAIPARVRGWLAAHAAERKPGRIGAIFVRAMAVIIVYGSIVQMSLRFDFPMPVIALVPESFLRPFCVVNTYGLFAVMTVKREEIVIEGSDDGLTWKEYEFRYKPGRLDRAPKWNIPHQPRLDWQMWFASLTDPQHVPWFPKFLKRLLEGEPTVLDLMEKNPFPDHPPKFVRALFYDYTYASPEEKAKGIWWDRTLVGTYFPQASLRTPENKAD